MSSIEGEEESGCSSTILNDSCDDPLAGDPLAIEDFNEVDTLSSCAELSEDVPKEDTIIENDPVNNIIFVDIEKLKGGKKKSGLEISPRKPVKQSNDASDSAIETNENIPKSKAENNRNTSDLVINTNNDNNNNENEKDDGIEATGISKLSEDLTETVRNPDNIEVQPNELNNLLKHRNVDNNFVNNNTSSETETEETFDPPVLLETDEIRCSDGSDSGLGLDTLRSVQAIERDLAKLTPSKSNLKRRSDGALDEEEEPKKVKRSINFGDVTVFYFPRTQGFGCVPSQGGSTLGMTPRHSYYKNFSLAEHAAEQRRQHRQQLNELNPCSSSSEESNTEEEPSENSGSEADSEVCGFLQPISAKQRRSILKAAGVRKIDITEKDECKLIRKSRETCGCSCRRYCDPDTCECSQNGIKCQVDRLKPNEYPCGCSRDECGNVNGRVEFDPGRVKTHYIHTIMRLGFEKKPEVNEHSGPTMLTGYHSSKWLPRIRLQHVPASQCDYSEFMYNNSMTASSPSSHYPINKLSNGGSPSAIHNGVLHNGGSLDLHDAFRDDYGTPNGAANGELSDTFNGQSTNEYYMNYNYMTNGNHYQNTYFNGMSQQAHPQSHYQGYSQYAGDNSLYPHSHLSSYVSTQNGFSNDHVGSYSGPPRGNSINYVNQQKMPQMNAINDLVTDSNSHVNNSDNSRSIVTPQPIYSAPQSEQIDNSSSVSANGTTNNSDLTSCSNNNDTNNSNSNNQQENQNQDNQNLCEIIKKSIVETVSA